MNYDRKIHITTDQLAALLGICSSRLAPRLWGGGPDAPRALFRQTVGGHQQSIYDKAAAVAWVDQQREEEAERKRGELVPARTMRPLSEQGQYRPSATRLALEARAARAEPKLANLATEVPPRGRWAYDAERV